MGLVLAVRQLLVIECLMEEHERSKGHGILSSKADKEGIGQQDRYQLGSVLMFMGLVFTCLGFGGFF